MNLREDIIMKKILIIEAVLFVIALVLLDKAEIVSFLAILGIFALPIFYFVKKAMDKRKDEIRPERTEYTDQFWLYDSNCADWFLSYYRDELDENEDYDLPAKQLHEDFDDEKVYRYDPFELPCRIEDGKVYSQIEDEWVFVGNLKKQDADQLENALGTTLYLYPNIYKYVSEEGISRQTEDPYFGVEVRLPIGQ